MIKRILVPVDFSDVSLNALSFAITIAEKMKAEVILFHSWLPYFSAFTPEELVKKENQQTRKSILSKLEAVAGAHQFDKRKTRITIILEAGPEQKRIVDFIRKKKIDLVVMGTTGAGGLKKMLMGSLTSFVIQHGACPVIAVPAKGGFSSLRKILYSTDLDLAEKDSLSFLRVLAAAFNSEVVYFHVKRKGELLNRKVQEFQDMVQNLQVHKKAGKPDIILSKAGDLSSAIIQASSRMKADLIVMVTYRREGLWNAVLDRSVTSDIACKTSVPLLALPIHGRRKS